MVVLMLHPHKSRYKTLEYIKKTSIFSSATVYTQMTPDECRKNDFRALWRWNVWHVSDDGPWPDERVDKQREEEESDGKRAEERKWQRKAGNGSTYMRREGLQGGDTLLWVRGFSFRKVGLQAWAGLIHRHGPTGPCGLPAFQGWGAGGVGVVWRAGDLIDIGCDLPPERGVLALQSVQLEETVSNILRAALSKASLVPCSQNLSNMTLLPLVQPNTRGTKTRWGKKHDVKLKKKKKKKEAAPW